MQPSNLEAVRHNLTLEREDVAGHEAIKKGMTFGTYLPKLRCTACGAENSITRAIYRYENYDSSKIRCYACQDANRF